MTLSCQQKWKRVGLIYPNRETGDWDSGVGAPHMVVLEDRVRMYYHGMLNGIYQIGFAEAAVSDLTRWEPCSSNPVLTIGPPGAIDSRWAGYPWIVRQSASQWILYYATFDGTLSDHGNMKVWQTSTAESRDGGLTWNRSGRPIIDCGVPGTIDSCGTGSCCVIPAAHPGHLKEWYMYYTAVDRGINWYRISIGLATSRDGSVTFCRHPNGTAIQVPPKMGCPGSTCSKPCVFFDGERYRMWFSCAQDGIHYRIHYAEADDGIHFRWNPEPVLDVADQGWDNEMTCYPSVFTVNRRTYMAYTGNGYSGIGLAELVSEGEPPSNPL
jgi:hypothetical protein